MVVDDSDYECAAIRQAFPQIEVIQTPPKPVDVPTCLDSVARLEVLSLTDEDLAKTDMYAQERQRRELKQSLGKKRRCPTRLSNLLKNDNAGGFERFGSPGQTHSTDAKNQPV